MTLAPALAALVLAAAYLVLRLAPIWPHRRQGCDAYYYLLAAEAFRRRRRLPIVLPPLYLLEPQEQAYPPMMSMVLGLIPERWVARFYWAIAPLVDALSLALVAVWIGARFGPVYAVLAGIAYAANASLCLEFGALSSRPLALFETNAFLLACFAWVGGAGWLLLPLAVALGVLVLYTHKLSVQLLWFLVPFLAAVAGDWRWLVPLAGAYLVAFAVAPRLFLQILDGHRDIVRFWGRNWPLLNAHIVRRSPLYAGPTAGGDFYRRHDLRWLGRQAAKVLDYNAFVVVLPVAALAWPHFGAVERFAVFWVVGTYLWGCATYFLRPLRCLGEGNKYFKYALLPSLFVAVAALVEAPGIASDAAAAFGAAWTGLSYGLTARRLRGTMPATARLSPALEPLLRRIEATDGARLMCLPTHLCDLVAYHTRRPVLWGTHGLGFTEAEPFFPVLRRPIEHFVTAYALTHLLLDRHYVTLDELRLGDANVVARSGDFLLVAFDAPLPGHP
ncbi:MAG TPA: hypothetical protein VMU87_22345 [Stellaceae bacterium]|nr:hypothetical protein [Stellaceae bacterium]